MSSKRPRSEEAVSASLMEAKSLPITGTTERVRRLLHSRKVGLSDGWSEANTAQFSAHKRPFVETTLPLRADEEYLYALLATRVTLDRTLQWIQHQATASTESVQLLSLVDGATTVFGTSALTSSGSLLVADEGFETFQAALLTLPPITAKMEGLVPSNTKINQQSSASPKSRSVGQATGGRTSRSSNNNNNNGRKNVSMIAASRDRWVEHMETTAKAQGDTLQSLRSDSTMSAYRLDVSQFAAEAEEREYKLQQAMEQRQQELALKRKQRRQDATLS